MRRLSEEVGRDPAVLYRHVPNKAALLDGVTEIVISQLRVDTADPDWAGQLRAVAHEFRQLALAHPNVVPLMVTRPLATPLGQRPPGMLRPLEDVLALLTAAGFSGPMPCTSTGCCSAICTATSSPSCRRSSNGRRSPTMCCDWVCTDCRSSSSRRCVHWLLRSGPTTVPPNSTAGSTCCSSGWRPPWVEFSNVRLIVRRPCQAGVMAAKRSPHRADLVLSGGGVKGIGLVGAVVALQDAGYAIERISGTSAGSLVGAVVAAAGTTQRLDQ